MDKQIVIYPYNGILLSNNKEWRIPITLMNLKNMLSAKSLKQKEHILYDSVYIKP